MTDLTSKDNIVLAADRLTDLKRLMKITHVYTTQVAENLELESVFIVNSPEMTFHIQRIRVQDFLRNPYRTTFRRLYGNELLANEFILPSYAASNMNVSGAISVAASYYTTLNHLINRDLKRPNEGSIDVAGEIINSDIISSLTLPDISSINVTCVHWDFTIGKDGSWSATGCKLISSNKTHTVCHCRHLTQFAVLMRVSGQELARKDRKILEVLTYIFCGISQIFLFITVVLFGLLRLNSERYNIHKHLILALFLAQICLLIGMNVSAVPILCRILAIGLHLCYLSVFMWMLVEGLHLYLQIVTVFDEKDRSLLYCAIGWGKMFSLKSLEFQSLLQDYRQQYATMIMEVMEGNKDCWLSIGNGLIWAFAGPAIVIILINFIIMLIVTKIAISKTAAVAVRTGNQHFRNLRTATRAIILLMPLLGLTWTFGLLAADDNTVFFAYLFVILNGLQGVFIFISQCVYNSEVRNGFRRFMNRYGLTSKLHRDFSTALKPLKSTTEGVATGAKNSSQEEEPHSARPFDAASGCNNKSKSKKRSLNRNKDLIIINEANTVNKMTKSKSLIGPDININEIPENKLSASHSHQIIN
ncbi:Adhesion G-protein coupled receptor D1 [Trichoplax sp. H2]|nr:Adhesion G-protein coupled receptor D1 [Trichoplax sp. H2]|eukprot:RDD44468.1 Adhesion G-protein coupled receptor D1 [Trichoplax sp. H2]